MMVAVDAHLVTLASSLRKQGRVEGLLDNCWYNYIADWKLGKSPEDDNKTSVIVFFFFFVAIS
jgi:hypothetical protein